jgi:hypothetical protein
VTAEWAADLLPHTDAAERWGRDRGATRAIVISYANSPSSVPFYEDRMGYERHTIGFLKPL